MRRKKKIKKDKNILEFILGLLTAAGLLAVSKAIPLNIRLLWALLDLGINGSSLQIIISQIIMFVFIILIALFLNLKIKFTKIFRYSFWIFLTLGYLLYLYSSVF